MKNIARTKNDLIREILRCGQDPVYFLNNYAKIQHPVKGLIPFETFEYQNDVIRAFLEHRLNIILKARQLGFTTIIAGFITWFIIFNKDKNVPIVATKREVAKATIRMIRTILKFMPKELMLCQIAIDNRQSIELSNGSRVTATATSADVGRSESVSLLFMDEVAHIEKMEEIWTSAAPTIMTGGRAILSSTPRGTSNFFYRTFKQAQAKENNFNCTFGKYKNPRGDEVFSDRFMWWVRPEYDQAWFANETAGKTSRDIAQEFLCNFNTSGDTFLPTETLQTLEAGCRDPIEIAYEDRNLWIWKYPEPGGVYVIAADISSGYAADYSAFHVLRVDGHLEQVAEYKGKIPPDMLGNLLMQVSQKFNFAVIAPENNTGWAAQTITRITDSNYPHLYWSSRTKDDFLDLYSSNLSANAIPGYAVTNKNRIEMLSKMEQYVRKEDIKINSIRLVDEFREFLWVNNRPQAARTANDDLIMSLAGAIWIREESYMATFRNVDITKALLSGITSTAQQFDNFRNDGQNGMAARNRAKQQYDAMSKMVLPNGEVIDLSSMIWSG